MKLLHFKVGFFAKNKHGDSVIGLDLVEIGDEGGHKFENEH